MDYRRGEIVHNDAATVLASGSPFLPPGIFIPAVYDRLVNLLEPPLVCTAALVCAFVGSATAVIRHDNVDDPGRTVYRRGAQAVVRPELMILVVLSVVSSPFSYRS